jgi:hypothetical protein
VVLESPPCPWARAWLLEEVSPEEVLAEDFPGFRGGFLTEVRAVAETAIEEVVP